MNVYDFDGTIFYSDCSIGFARWCLLRHPKLWVTYFPRVVKSLIALCRITASDTRPSSYAFMTKS